jgi:hypothetical protein
MKNKGNMSSDELNIQKVLGNFLQLKVAGNGLTAEGKHLDEDSLTAFVEGNLREKESLPIVNHLVDCTFCRHVTAELVKLDFALADENVHVVAQKSEELSPVSKVLNDILARIFGSNEGVVFAHQETEEDDKEKEDLEENN